MKKFAVCFTLMSAVLPVLAGSGGGGSNSPIVAVAFSEPRVVATTLTIPADFVAAPIRVKSDQKSASAAYEESRENLELISQKAKEAGFRVVTGVVSLSHRESGFGLSSGAWKRPAASAEIFLLVPLEQDHTNMFSAGAEAARFVEGLKLTGKASCTLGELQLAVENAEQYRPRLLELMSQEMKKTRAALAAEGGIRAAGLESPVLVRQVDDRQVELFLNYTMSVDLDR
jgi:hypothetical protein